MKTKFIALAGVATLAIATAIPVAASHNHGLRGMFNYESGHNTQQQYVPAQSWQAKRLTQQHSYQAQPAYVETTSANCCYGNASPQLGLRGFQNADFSQNVYYSREAAQKFKSARQYDVGGITVRTNPYHSRDMLDWQENVTGKTMTLLANRANGVLKSNSLYIGAGFQGGLK